MATYVNDLRLKEIATGDEAGTWGTSTNTNLELIAEAFSYGTEASFGSDADATTTIADGSTDPVRSLYLKVTSGASLTATRTLTIAPNTVSKVWIIENATTGSQSINISQGSGANVTIPNGDVKVVYSDGAGSGAAVVDAFANLKVTDPAQTNITSLGTLSTLTVDDITINDSTISDSGEFTIDAGGDIILDADGGDIKLKDGGTQFGSLGITGTSDLAIVSSVNDKDIKFFGQDGGGQITALTLDMSEAGAATFNSTVTATGTSVFASLDISGDIDVDGTTNLDVVDIDGASNFAANATFVDGIRANFGTGEDLQISHTGSNSLIADTGTGDLKIRANDLKLEAYASEDSYITMVDGGAVTLFHDNSSKLATTSSGIDVTGTVTSDGADIDGAAVFNESSADVDFRVESNGQTYALFVNGGLDNVGIGYSSEPTATLQGLNILTGGGNGGIQLNREVGGNPSNGETLGSYGWKGQDGANSNAAAEASIVAIAAENHSGSTAATSMFFNTKPAGTGPGSAPTERMRITSAGRVGIGTDTPDAPFVVSNAGAAGMEFHPEIDTDTNRLTNYDRTANEYMNFRVNALTHQFYSSASETVRIDSSGNILLNQTTSLIAGNTSDGSDNKSVMVNGGGAASDSRGAYVWAKGNEFSSESGFLRLNAGNVSGAAIAFNTGGSEKMRIENGGDVGIGTTNAEQKVHIVDTSNPGNDTGSVIIEGRRDGTANLLELRARDNGHPSNALPDGQGGIMRFTGFDGTDFEELAFIGAQADGQDVANGDSPGRLIFGTTADTDGSASTRLKIESQGNVVLEDGVPFHVDTGRAGPNISVGTSFVTMIDFSTLGGTNPSRGFYLVTAVREGASVGTSIVCLVGVSSSSLCIIYDTISSSGLTAQASGATFQIKQPSGGAVNCHATAIPISIHGRD